MEFIRNTFVSPELPIENAIVVGSYCLLAYADKYGLEPKNPLKANDIDLVVRPETYDCLERSGWHVNEYRGTRTLRDQPDGRHIYDVGTGVHKWSYEDIVRNNYSTEHKGVAYLDPLRMLDWKLALNRKKDSPHIELLATLALPTWIRDQYKKDL